MGGKKPKVKQVNFTPPAPAAPVKTPEQIAYEQQLAENLRLQNEAYSRQIQGLQQQQDAQAANSTTLIATLQQQLEEQRKKSAADAVAAAKATEALNAQTAIADAQRQATEVEQIDSSKKQRGFLNLSSRRQSSSRNRKRRTFLGYGN